MEEKNGLPKSSSDLHLCTVATAFSQEKYKTEQNVKEYVFFDEFKLSYQ